MRRLLVAIGLVCALVTASGAQPAPSNEERARELYEKGNRHFKLGEYDEAIDAFKESYRLSEAPLLLYNLAQAHRLKGSCGQAALLYRNYLRDDPKGPYAAAAKQQLPKMEKCAKEKGQSTEAPPKEPVPPPVEPKPPDPPPPVEPKPAEPAITTDPRPPQPEIKPELEPEVKPETKPDARLDVPLRRDDSPPSRGKGLRLAGIGVAVVGAVLVGVSGVYFTKAKKASDDVESMCGSQCTWNDELQERQQEGRKAQRVGFTTLGIGTAAIAGGTVMYLLGRKAGREARVSIGPGGGSVAWAWSF
jgi:hypothetical protein